MASRFNLVPKAATGSPRPFNLRVSDHDLSEFRDLLSLSKIGPATWWNKHTDNRFGVSREWLSRAKEAWLNSFDWRKHEEEINSFPNFKINVTDREAGNVELHFAALFSSKQNAIPIIFLHGFPASFTEFLPMMHLLAKKYTPENLPYHVIVPSLPDYGLSGGSSEDIEMSVHQAARMMNQLMVDLGFGAGYIAQGGDLGSMLARIMSVENKECRAFHINMLTLNASDKVSPRGCLTAEEAEILKRTEAWQKTGLAYALEHGTRPATAGLAMSSNPLALLAWIGEKLLEWVDPQEPFPLSTVLAMVSFYWFTNTFPRSLYHAELIKTVMEGKDHPISKEKPMGYSMFAYDLVVLPQAWARQLYPNIVFYKAHSMGGHFASLEKPELFLGDIEEFAGKVGELFRE